MKFIAILCAYIFGMIYSRGNLPLSASELFWSLPVAIDTYCHLALAVMLTSIQKATPNQLLDPKRILRKSAGVSAVLGVRKSKFRRNF